MKRITAYVTEGMLDQLRLLAYNNHVSFSEVIKFALQNLINQTGCQKDGMLSEVRAMENMDACHAVGYFQNGFPLADIKKCTNNEIPDLGCKGCPARDEQRNFIEGWKDK